jgi:hypothetical protein
MLLVSLLFPLFPSTALSRVDLRPSAAPADTARTGPNAVGGSFLVPELASGKTITLNCANADWPTGSESLSFTAAATSGSPGFSFALVISHPDDVMADEHLYLYVQVNDGTPVAGDNVVLMFDNSHDQTVASTASYQASDDRGIRFYRDKTRSVERIFGSSVTPGVGPAGGLVVSPCIHGGGLNGVVGGGSWTVEAELRPSDVGLNNFNSLLGASVVARSAAPNASLGVWPSMATANPADWASLVTRQPVDYILLVDQSGSMSGNNKWPSAKQAADNFALVLSKTKDAELDAQFPLITNPVTVGSGDRLGLGNFTSAFPAPPPPPGWSSEVTSLATIPANPGSFSGGLPPNPGGGTPIAGGLNRTFQMFGGAGTLAGSRRTRVVMLLSDGMHNTPNSTIDMAAPSADLDYLPTCGDNSLVRVSTVAVGTDATVDVTKLSDIKNCYRLSGTDPGAASFTTYNTVDPVGVATEGKLTAALTKFFIQTIEPHFQWNTINQTGADFTINAGDRRLLLFAFWTKKSDAVNLSITRPGGTVATGSSNTSLGYSWLLLDSPPNGTYTGFTAAGAAAKFVLVDLGVRGDFAIDNRPHGTGGSILLRARLRERGQPVLGAEVRTDIARPGEGFGTYASTHTLSNCVASPPQLPAPIHGEGPSAIRFDTAVGLPPDTTGDAKPPAFALVAALFQQCGKTAFSRLSESGRQLFDDGSHGDATAGDGIYTLAMDNTQFEGSYVFQFRATGLTSDGKPFSRIHETAAYVGVEVDPGSSPVGSRVLHVAGNLVTQEFWVLPLSSEVEYFGPGHADKVSFALSGNGTLVGPVVDYTNGYYSQIVRYDRTQRAPVVTPVVNGKPLNPINARPRPWELVVPFAGATFLDNALGLDDGFVVGARVGHHLSGPLWVEAEGGVTFAKAAGNSGQVIQLLGNLRYDLATGEWVPYVTAGAGYALFRGFATDDEAFLFQGGAGATLYLSPRFGLRADARVLRIGSVFGRGSSTNVQMTGGLVWWF